jgi:hypothetical protein
MAILSGVNPKNVGDPTDAYESLKPIWDKNHAVCGGEQYVKEKDRLLDAVSYSNMLIPFSPSMTQQQYSFFKAEAELPGIVSQFAKMLIGSLLRKQPALELPANVPKDATAWILEEFGTDNSPITAFLKDALWEEMKTDNTWIYVGYPEVPNAADLTREEKLKYRPSPVIWPAETVINVRTVTDVYGQETLKHVIVRGYQEVFEDDDTFHPELIETVWVHDIDPEGSYRIRTYTEAGEAQRETVNGQVQYNPEGSGKTFKLDKTQDNLTKNGEKLKYIPAWPLNGDYTPREPFVTPLVDKEVALYNKVSRRNHLMYGASTFTPWIASDMNTEEFEEVVSKGLGTWIRLDQDDSIGVLATPSDALEDMEKTIAAAIEEMARLGIRILAPENAQSGVALMIRNAAQTAQLGSLNVQVSNTLRQIIAFMLEWRYGVEVAAKDVSFTMSADFETGQIGVDWLRLATEWYQLGLIPRKIWLNLLKQNDMLSGEYNDEEGQQEINDDELILSGSEGATDDKTNLEK